MLCPCLFHVQEDESDGDDSYRDVKGLSGEVCTVVGEMGDDVVIIGEIMMSFCFR